MENEEKYELLAEGERVSASVMAIIPDNNYRFESDKIEKSLRNNKDFKLLSFEESKDNLGFSLQSYKAEISYLDQVYVVELFVCKTDNLHLADYDFANYIDEDSLETAAGQPYYLETSMYFGSDSLVSFHLQLKIMDAVVPKASVVVDFMSYRLLSAKWLKMSAKSTIPPSPDYLYTLHCVYDQKGEDDIKQYWFHTHGLHRCGSVELEMLNLKQGAEQMHTLMNRTVTKFLSDPAKERERFTIGYDGMGLNLCWLRWEEALKDFPVDCLGGIEDREGEGNIHAESSGVLFAVEEGNMVSPEIYAQTLADNPIYYITTEETNRMSALAKERFDIFKSIFEREGAHAHKKSFFKNIFKTDKEEKDEWDFLVKLGLSVDNQQAGSEKEHLWFHVLSITGDIIECKLLNEPYWIDNLHEGNVNKYSTDLLTDWIIYSPDSTYTSDSVYQLVDM